MKIIVNNRETETNAETLFSLAKELNLPQNGIAVGVNNRVSPRSEWQKIKLEENMQIVIVKAVCGG